MGGSDAHIIPLPLAPADDALRSSGGSPPFARARSRSVAPSSAVMPTRSSASAGAAGDLPCCACRPARTPAAISPADPSAVMPTRSSGAVGAPPPPAAPAGPPTEAGVASPPPCDAPATQPPEMPSAGDPSVSASPCQTHVPKQASPRRAEARAAVCEWHAPLRLGRWQVGVTSARPHVPPGAPSGTPPRQPPWRPRVVALGAAWWLGALSGATPSGAAKQRTSRAGSRGPGRCERVSDELAELARGPPAAYDAEHHMRFFASRVESFDVRQAVCTIAEDRQRLSAVIEAGFVNLDNFNRVISGTLMRSLALAAETRRRSPLKRGISRSSSAMSAAVGSLGGSLGSFLAGSPNKSPAAHSPSKSPGGVRRQSIGEAWLMRAVAAVSPDRGRYSEGGFVGTRRSPPAPDAVRRWRSGTHAAQSVADDHITGGSAPSVSAHSPAGDAPCSSAGTCRSGSPRSPACRRSRDVRLRRRLDCARVADALARAPERAPATALADPRRERQHGQLARLWLRWRFRLRRSNRASRA